MDIISIPEERGAFIEAYENVLLPLIKKDIIPPKFKSTVEPHILKLIDYTVPNGKGMRGALVVETYCLVAPKEKQTKPLMRDVRLLGWLIDMMQAAYLIFDDIADDGETRRGQLCWHRKPEVGLTALYDALYIENIAQRLMRREYKGRPYYRELLKLSQDADLICKLGFAMDNHWSGSNPKFDEFTAHNYFTMVKNKAPIFAISFPIRAALNMAGITDKTLHDDLQQLCIKIGVMRQGVDDYLDLYANPRWMGKNGNDITEGKLTWFIVKALEMVKDDETVKQKLTVNYGKKEKECEKIVKSVYENLKLREKFDNWFEEEMEKINIEAKEFCEKYQFPFSLFERIIDHSKELKRRMCEI